MLPFTMIMSHLNQKCAFSCPSPPRWDMLGVWGVPGRIKGPERLIWILARASFSKGNKLSCQGQLSRTDRDYSDILQKRPVQISWGFPKWWKIHMVTQIAWEIAVPHQCLGVGPNSGLFECGVPRVHRWGERHWVWVGNSFLPLCITSSWIWLSLALRLPYSTLTV